MLNKILLITEFDAPDKNIGNNILFAIDFSDNSYQAFEYLKEVAKSSIH